MYPKEPIPVTAIKTTGSRIFAVALIVMSLAGTASAQFAAPGELPGIDARIRAAIIDSITAVIDSIYVLEEPAQRIVTGLRNNLANGDYDDLTDPVPFVERLYREAQAINHDGHFQIAAMPPLDPAAPSAEGEPDPADDERRRRLDRAQNFGFKKAEILSGGIGYLRFDQFSHGDEAFAAAAAAMNFLSHCNALILDLRSNGGGSASMIRFLCGYLFEEKAHLINWDIRAEKKTVQSYSADYVPGNRMLEQPVYILTSRRTFSAAEEFTFDLRNLERATVVGDTTGGGGHTVATYIFDFEGFRVGIRVPYGRAYNPENNEGWEGVGVIPHIAVPAEQALDTAHADALRKLIAAEEDEPIIASYRWGLADLDSRLNPWEPSKDALEQYVGVFGPRRIFLEEGNLYYERTGRSRYRMEPMSEDLFRLIGLDYFRVSFGRDETGTVVKIIGLYDDGRSDESERDPG
ncbi:MAG: S41 family peptidase [Candidatus Krumholzibacteriia bacterium]